MIQGFRHRGLKQFYEKGSVRYLMSDQVPRIQKILTALDVAATPVDMDLPGYHLHALKGELKGFWSVRVSGNWRIVFRFDDGGAKDVDLMDYH